MMYYANINKKKAGIAVLKSGNVCFRTKTTSRRRLLHNNKMFDSS